MMLLSLALAVQDFELLSDWRSKDSMQRTPFVKVRLQ